MTDEDLPAADAHDHGDTLQSVLRRLISARSLSIRSVETGAGVSADGLRSCLRNRTHTPAPDVLMKVAAFLGADLDYLRGLPTEPTRPQPNKRRPAPPPEPIIAPEPVKPLQSQPIAASELPRTPMFDVPIYMARAATPPEPALDAPSRRAGTWPCPAGMLYGLADDPGTLIACRTPSAFPPNITGTTWLLIDTSVRALGRGDLCVAWDGERHVLVRGSGRGEGSLADGSPMAAGAGMHVLGKVVFPG